MSAKRRIFPSAIRPPGQWQDKGTEPGPYLDDGENLYTGHPDFGSGPHDEEDASQPGARGSVKGHAAYAAQDEMPPYTPRGAGLGSVGGLLGDDAASRQRHNAQVQGEGDDLLSMVPKDALRAECEKRVCPSCQVKKEADDARLRALADLDNAKKRLAREREEQVRYAAESVLSDVIPSLDNLDLALQHAGGHEACKDFVVGVQMTRKLMGEALGKHGLTQVGEVGEEFNPAVHEAVGMVNSPDIPDGHVCALLSNGYKLNDRLLRPARVMVCKKG